MLRVSETVEFVTFSTDEEQPQWDTYLLRRRIISKKHFLTAVGLASPTEGTHPKSKGDNRDVLLYVSLFVSTPCGWMYTYTVTCVD